MNKWRVQYNNDTAQDDEFYWSWWEVTDDARTFKSSSEDEAQWLCDLLNTHEAYTNLRIIDDMESNHDC